MAGLLCSCSDDSPGSPVPYAPAAGQYEVGAEYSTFIDEARGWDDDGTWRSTREIPIKLYAPSAEVPGPFPVLLLSHGLGGDLEAQAYLAEYLVSNGYIVVAVQHHRSDADYLNKMPWLQFLADSGEPQTRQLRPGDLSLVLDRLSDYDAIGGSIVQGRMDLARVGVLGHSFGAWTALSCLGQSFDGGTDASDPRFSCGVAFSPQAPGTLGIDEGAWAGIASPVMTMGGTLDTSPGTTEPGDRRAAFDGMPADGTKYHATLEGAEHSDFGNGGDGFYHERICQMTVAFFDAFLEIDAGAKDWLDSGAIEAATSYVSLERK